MISLSSRRDFLRYSGATGVVLGAGPLAACFGGADGEDNQSLQPRRMERRTYFFNLSHLPGHADHDHHLVCGNKRNLISQSSVLDWDALRAKHPLLALVANRHLTHTITMDFPADALQIGYIHRSKRGVAGGSGNMAMLFCHRPVATLERANLLRRQRSLSSKSASANTLSKWTKYGLTNATVAGFNDLLAESTLISTDSSAETLVSFHPELMSVDPDSNMYVSTDVIWQQPGTFDLSDSLARQGDQWATNVPLLKPDGTPYLDSSGLPVFMTNWSAETARYVGYAANSSLDTAKDDPLLGFDRTTVSTTNPPAASAITGKLWMGTDGRSSVQQPQASALKSGSESPSFTTVHQNPGFGYELKVANTTADGAKTTVEVEVKNSYIRYLGLYSRFLDGAGNPLDRAGQAIQKGGEEYFLVGTVAPEFCILGIPVKEGETSVKISVPASANSVQLLAGGLGIGSSPSQTVLTDGIALTSIFNLAMPALLLATGAAAGLSVISASLADASTMKEVLEFIETSGGFKAEAGSDIVGALEGLAVKCAGILAGHACEAIDEMIFEAAGISAAEDCIPIVGFMFGAIAAAGTVAQITQTSTQVTKSPKVYTDTITFTHDLVVTIKPDPLHPSTFPATATHYLVTASFDGGTAYTNATENSNAPVPMPQGLSQLGVTFRGVPSGGKVVISVGLYSDSGWLAGQATYGPVDNLRLTQNLSLTITENKVPLTAQTLYTHNKKTQLDAKGNHVWSTTKEAPALATPGGACTAVAGQICLWNNLTVSTVNAALGYAWQAANTSLASCNGGASGSQMHQFANLSTTGDPQSGYFISDCGFTTATRVVYDLMGTLLAGGTSGRNFYLDSSGGKQFIRQIHLSATGPSSFDGPTSNLAFGRLNFASDALLLHPSGKIISVSTGNNSYEVLDLPTKAVSDANAPYAEVRSGPGRLPGRLSGPVHAAITAQGAILVLEKTNNRIQAFDLGGNPVRCFAKSTTHFFPLKDTASAYLDIAVEYTGYIYVLSYVGSTAANTFRMDIYNPQGEWISRTSGVNADKLAVDYWRNAFTLNYEVLKMPDGSLPARTEPSISQWIPSTP